MRQRTGEEELGLFHVLHANWPKDRAYTPVSQLDA